MTSELLKNILDDLDDDELSTFHFFLRQPNNVQDLPSIKKSQLQTTNRCNTVDVMVQTYGDQRAVQVTRVVLEKINRNDLLKRFPTSSSGPEDVMLPVPETRPIRDFQEKVQSNFQDKSLCSPEECAADEHRLVDMETLRVTPTGVQWLTAGLRKYSCQLTVDTNTVGRGLKLSDNNRKVTCVEIHQSYPDHPDRFNWPQLLCRTGLTGRCYWEVEWKGEVYISVSYIGIRRRGNNNDCQFGYNDQSWSLICSDVFGYSVRHDKSQTSIRSSSVSHRVSVYVDVDAGTLSFYRVSSDSLIHLHTFNTTFTEPLYPGFRIWSCGSSVSLC